MSCLTRRTAVVCFSTMFVVAIILVFCLCNFGYATPTAASSSANNREFSNSAVEDSTKVLKLVHAVGDFLLFVVIIIVLSLFFFCNVNILFTQIDFYINL